MLKVIHPKSAEKCHVTVIYPIDRITFWERKNHSLKGNHVKSHYFLTFAHYSIQLPSKSHLKEIICEHQITTIKRGKSASLPELEYRSPVCFHHTSNINL